MDDEDFFPAPTLASVDDRDFQNDMISGLQLDEATIHSVLQQERDGFDLADEEAPLIDFNALDRVLEAQKPKQEPVIGRREEEVELDEDELREAEEEFQNYLDQNSTVHIVNERSLQKAFNLPPAPEGFRYDMSKNPPELVKKKQKKKVVKFADSRPKAKPTMEQQVDLVCSTYAKALTTNETYKVPQRYNWLPKGSKTNSVAPCTNPATYCDLSHFPDFFRSEEEAISTYNQMAYQYKMQLKKHGVCRAEGGHVTKFSLVCQKKQLTKTALKNAAALELKRSGLCDCPFLVQFKWKADRNGYVRTKRVNYQHTHPLEVKHRNFVKSEIVIRELKLYVECMITPAQAHLLINKKFQIQSRYSEVYAAYKQVKNAMHTYIDYTTSDTQQLLQLLEQMKKDNPKMRFAYQLEDPGENSLDPTVKRELKIDRMFIQTPIMAKYYQKYHDVVFMDATYNTNKHNLALAIISGISSEGKNIIMGIAFLARETIDHYQWLLKTLVDFNGGIEPKTFMTDFDSSMCGGIEATFNKTTHLLCQWHMMQNFKKHFVFLSKRKNAHSKMMYNHIMDAIFTESPARFQQLQDIIFQSPDLLDEAKLNYLRQLFQIKEKWASAHQPIQFTSGIHTIQRAESVNSQVKHKLTKKTSLKELFELILSVEKKVIEKTVVYSKNYARQVIHHPLLRHIFENYSTFAFEQMFYQFMQSHQMSVVDRLAPKGSSHEHRLLQVTDESGIGMFSVREMERGGVRDKMQVIIKLEENQGYQVSCNCRYFWSFNLYCSHIFAVLNLLQIRTLEKFEPYSRWTKRFHASVYRDVYPELDVPAGPSAPPKPFELGDRTKALLSGRPHEPKRDANGVPVSTQQESSQGFDFAMFEKTMGGQKPQITEKGRSTENPEVIDDSGDEGAPKITMIDTTKTKQQKQREQQSSTESLEVTNYVAPGFFDSQIYPAQLLQQASQAVICTPGSSQSQPSGLHQVPKQLTQISSFPASQSIGMMTGVSNQGSTRGFTVDLSSADQDSQKSVKPVMPKPIPCSTVPPPMLVTPGMSNSSNLVSKLIAQSQNALQKIQSQIGEASLLQRQSQSIQDFKPPFCSTLGLNSSLLKKAQNSVGKSASQPRTVVLARESSQMPPPPPQLVTAPTIAPQTNFPTQLAVNTPENKSQQSRGALSQDLSQVTVPVPISKSISTLQVSQDRAASTNRGAVCPLPETVIEEEDDYADPSSCQPAVKGSSLIGSSDLDRETARLLQMQEQAEKASSHITSSLLKQKAGGGLLANQHKKVMSTLQQQMQLERAKINQGQSGFKDHFKNVFN